MSLGWYKGSRLDGRNSDRPHDRSNITGVDKRHIGYRGNRKRHREEHGDGTNRSTQVSNRKYVFWNITHYFAALI